MLTHTQNGKSFRLSHLVSAVSLSLSGMLLPGISFAADDTIGFDIKSQSLSKALIDFSLVSKHQVAFDPELIKGFSSQNVSGELTPEQALQQLLAGTGLTIATVNGDSFTLVAGTPERTSRLAGTEGIPGVSNNDDVETIVVTGENILRRLLDTNTSINVQTQEDIVRSNDKRISDVFTRAANVNVNGTGLQAFTFSIRGINSSGIGGAGSAPVAALTVDGAAFSTQQLSRGYNSLFDIEQVEMLRGPQSTSQARNSLAGAVVVQTKNPEFYQDTQAIAAIANYGTYELGVANTGALSEDFAYRITVHRLNTDGFIENPVLGTDAYNYNDTDTVRAKLLYAPKNSPLELLFSYTHVQADARNDVNSWFPDTQEFINSNPFGIGGMHSEQDVATFSVSYEFSDKWSLKA